MSQLFDVTVHLGGDMTSTVRKYGVTPAEIALLIAVHGMVTNIDFTSHKWLKAPSADALKDELAAKYKRARVGNGETKSALAAVFPGWPHNPTMPTDIAKLGLKPEFFATEYLASVKAVKPGSKKAKAGEPEPDALAGVDAGDAVDPLS